MKSSILTLAVGTLAIGSLAGCGESRLNPMNWYKTEMEARTSTLEPEGGYVAAATEYRVPIERVTKLTLRRTQGGAIVEVVGLAPTQGYWDAELLSLNGSRPVDGEMAYSFVVTEPDLASEVSQRTGPERTREITVAAFISNARLSQVNRVTVTGASNSMSVSR